MTRTESRSLGRASRLLSTFGMLCLVVLAPPLSLASGSTWHWETLSCPSTPHVWLTGVSQFQSLQPWAVGSGYRGDPRQFGAVVAHRGSSGWNFHSPSFIDAETRLADVAVSRRSVWVVGSRQNTKGVTVPLVERRVAGKWRTEDLSHLVTTGNLGAVWASSGTVFVVGRTTNRLGTNVGLVLRWSDGVWMRVRTPRRVGGVTAASAIGPLDLWVLAGHRGLLHWNGTSWDHHQTVPRSTTLNALADVSSSDAWAVGATLDASVLWQTEVLHWNGAAWSLVATPSTNGILRDVGVIDASNVWAVGSKNNNASTTEPLVLFWDGSVWSEEGLPKSGSGVSQLDGISVGDARWAIGENAQKRCPGALTSP